MEGHNLAEYKEIVGVLNYLELNFFQIYEDIPTSLCHGDFHILNIIWGENKINAVIDWEFCSQTVELYDAALMVGCLGMENPEALERGIVKGFIAYLLDTGIYANISWQNFFELIVGIRLLWLSQWLKYGDKDMIDLEIIYLKLLLDNENYFKELWGIDKFN